ncbi:MAG: alpha/beta fold hydrolase [Isosphaeraceae bacterium]
MRATMLGLSGICLLAMSMPARADDLKKLEGSWEGLLKVTEAIELRLVLRVETRPDEAPKVVMDSPDQGAKDIPTDSATYDPKTEAVAIELKIIGGSFSGKRNDAGTELVGVWKQSGMSWPITLKKTDIKPLPTDVWEGTLMLPNDIKLRVVFRVTNNPDGSIRATMDSPDQGANGIKVDEAIRKDGKIQFVLKAIQGEYSGTINKEATEASGEWKQGGASFPLNLKKVPNATEARRPQEPRFPYPYKTEEVVYENKEAGIKLAATLTVPQGDGPFPAVVLITGSGPQDRDESLMGHRPFLVLADALTRRGIAVLRADDRGVGKSTGEFARATSIDFAGDVEAGVAYLKTRHEIQPKAIGLVGHSEGGLIAPIVATRTSDVAYIVLMAGTGLTGAEILEMQSGLILQAMGGSESAVEGQKLAIRKLAAIAVSEPDPARSRDAMKLAVQSIRDALPESERKPLEVGQLDSRLDQFTSPWFRYFLSYDPRSTLKKVRCPVLAINGEKDLQVPPKENLAEIEKALKAGGNTSYTIRELPGLNHLFQACKTGTPSEYGSIEETLNPAALVLMGDWILETAKRTGEGGR